MVHQYAFHTLLEPSDLLVDIQVLFIKTKPNNTASFVKIILE